MIVCNIVVLNLITVLMYNKNQCKGIALTFSYKILLDCFTLGAKSILLVSPLSLTENRTEMESPR